MFSKEKVLKKLGLEEIIGTPLMREVYIRYAEAGHNGDLYGYSDGASWYILKGRVKGTSYFEDESYLNWELEEGEWFGMENSILKTKIEYDGEAYSDVAVLEIPLRKILESKHTSNKLLRRIIKIMASTTDSVIQRASERLGYNDERYFLRYMERNGFNITHNNIKELSDMLNINNRTFQRILKRLEDKKIIYREKRVIKIKNMTLYREYLDEISK